MYTIGHLVNGESVTTDNQTLPVFNPAEGQQIAHVEIADSQIIEAAIHSSKTAFTSWSQTAPLKRARILYRFKALLETHMDELAKLVTKEHGKTFDDAKGSVLRAIEVVEHNCGIANLLQGDYSNNVSKQIDTYTMRQPLGVCVGVSPFNFPVMVATWMIVPAIACGNTFILKPSEKTPSATLRLVELLHEAGLPPGVVNLVNGDKSVVDCLLKHSDTCAVTAVASTPVAEHIYQTATANGKRSHTFGGAKNHCIVMPDANINQAASAIAGAAFGAAGERCMALSVAVVIGDKTATALREALLSECKKIQVSNGMDENVDMGPLISEPHLHQVSQYLETGCNEGADLAYDGRQHNYPNQGYFLGPCLFDHVKPTMDIYQKEIFGPVLCLVRTDDFDEAISLINQHQFGNGTAIFTNDGYAAREFAHRIQVGMVGINIPIPVPVAYHPFGGWKRSVFGNTNMHGNESIQFYTKLKTVTSRWLKDDGNLGGFVMPTNQQEG